MEYLKNGLILMMAFLLLIGCSRKAGWELTWSDEFDYTGSPASESWGYETGRVRNNELQYYTTDLKNVRVENGLCIITALREEGGYSNTSDSIILDSITSASINTLGKHEFLYGRIEVRAKIPSAPGTWPAIWMMGTSIGELGWPECGEIDIMENVGYDPDLVHANIHTKAYNHVIGTNKGNEIGVKAPWSDFHIYAVEWFENRMDFFMDDSLYFSFENDLAGNNDTWPFNKPHYLLMNLAYGGDWGGQQGVDTSRLPVEYRIDYVRYYQKPTTH
jgi:beta-glucanase (GH16 family)